MYLHYQVEALIYFCLSFYLLTRAKKINLLNSLGSFKSQICCWNYEKYGRELHRHRTRGKKRESERKIDGRKERGNFRRNSALRPFGCLYFVLTLSQPLAAAAASLCSTSYGLVRFYFILPGLHSYDSTALERIESGNCETRARSLLIKSDEMADIGASDSLQYSSWQYA